MSSKQDKKEEFKLASKSGVRKGSEKALSDGTLPSTELAKPFQRLLFLIRDWQNFGAEWEEDDTEDKKGSIYATLRREMDTFIEETLAQRAIADLQSTREQITRCFEKVDCFMLPHPGSAVTKRTFDGDIVKIEPFFRSMLNLFTRQILDKDLQPKVMHGRCITAKEIFVYFDVYVRMFQSGNRGFPKAMTMLEATAEANNRGALELALEGYTKSMGTVIGNDSPFVQEAALLAAHNLASMSSLALFDEVATIGTDSSIADFRARLQTGINSEFTRLQTINSLRNPYKDLEMYLLPLAVTVSAWFVATLFDVLCDSAACQVVEDTFKRLYMFVASFILFLAFNKPFKDVSLYLMPTVIAVSAWFVATIINVSCNTNTCEKTEGAFVRVYLFIFFSLCLLGFKNFRTSFSHLQTLLGPALAGVQGGNPVAPATTTTSSK